MHDVLANGQSKVAADGARGGLGNWVGAASQLTPCLDGALALDNTSDKRCGGDELDEVTEEWLVLVLLVVLLRGLAVSNAQIELSQLQALALDAGDDFAYVAVLYAVRLDENQCTFSHAPHCTETARMRRALGYPVGVKIWRLMLCELLDYLFSAPLRSPPEPQAYLAYCGAKLPIAQQSLQLRALLLIQILKGGFFGRLKVAPQRQNQKNATNDEGD